MTTKLLIAIAKPVESDLTWTEVEEIGDRIAQGETFNSVHAKLNLSQRVSPDMVDHDNEEKTGLPYFLNIRQLRKSGTGTCECAHV